MNVEQLREHQAEKIKAIEKENEIFRQLLPFLSPGFNKLGHFSTTHMFLNEVDTLAELMGVLGDLKGLDPEFDRYYIAHTSTHLAVVFTTNQDIEIVTFCRDITGALAFFANGNCKVEEITEVTTSKRLTCMV